MQLYYEGHPEHALRLYKRMAQIGAGTAGAELWCNIGLCCYAAMQVRREKDIFYLHIFFFIFHQRMYFFFSPKKSFFFSSLIS